MAAPREEYLAQASIYDRIVVLPTSTAVAATGPSGGPTRPTPVMPMAPPADPQQQGNADDGDEPQAQPAGQPFNPYVNTGVRRSRPTCRTGPGGVSNDVPYSVTMPQVQPAACCRRPPELAGRARGPADHAGAAGPTITRTLQHGRAGNGDRHIPTG
jgi:hypothetical protein